MGTHYYDTLSLNTVCYYLLYVAMEGDGKKLYVSIEGDGRNIYVTMKVTSRHGSDGRNMFNVAWR